jgi:hypothetical protein
MNSNRINAESFPCSSDSVKLRHAALAPSLAAAYIFDNGFQRWIDFDSGSDNGRTKNRPAENRRVTFRLSQRPLLRIVEQSKGQVRGVHASSLELVSRARRGDGPAFLHCNTYRFHGHHVGDIDRAYYRSKKEEQEWKTQRDPVRLLADWLQKNKLADSDLLQTVDQEISEEIIRAVKFALAAPFPALDEVDQHVYA